MTNFRDEVEGPLELETFAQRIYKTRSLRPKGT
jgi:hypothetical protein